MRKEDREAGLLAQFLAEDHRRLDALLESAVAETGQVNHKTYDQFRAGLLRHIGMEEKILFPAVQRWRGGEPLPIAATLRLDHGALATLLMPTPTPAILATIRRLLTDHNALEEGPGGLYDLCDQLAGSEAEQLLVALRAVPSVAVMPHSDSPAVMNTLRRTLERAGYHMDGAIGHDLPVGPAQDS
jgi:hypothetical protein